MDRSLYSRGRLIVLLAASMALATVGVAYAAAPTKTSTVWAEVFYTGSVQASSGGITGTRNGIGNYTVNFGKDVSHCAIVVTSGIASETGGVPVGGVNAEVAALFPTANPLAINVLEDVGTVATDYSFSVVAVC